MKKSHKILITIICLVIIIILISIGYNSYKKYETKQKQEAIKLAKIHSQHEAKIKAEKELVIANNKFASSFGSGIGLNPNGNHKIESKVASAIKSYVTTAENLEYIYISSGDGILTFNISNNSGYSPTIMDNGITNAIKISKLISKIIDSETIYKFNISDTSDNLITTFEIVDKYIKSPSLITAKVIKTNKDFKYVYTACASDNDAPTPPVTTTQSSDSTTSSSSDNNSTSTGTDSSNQNTTGSGNTTSNNSDSTNSSSQGSTSNTNSNNSSNSTTPNPSTSVNAGYEAENIPSNYGIIKQLRSGYYQARLHSRPSAHSSYSENLAGGTKVQILNEKYYYDYVKAPDGNKGYVFENYITEN